MMSWLEVEKQQQVDGEFDVQLLSTSSPTSSVLLYGTLCVSEGAIQSLVFPKETSNSYVQLYPLKPLSLKAFTLCLRVATELCGRREIILFAYRSRRYDELNLWREKNGRLSLYFRQSGVLFKMPETLNAEETHLCFTWDSGSGAASLFMDGKKSLAKIFKPGYTVPGDGCVILGQDTDSTIGIFDPKQSFVGEIGDVNMWDRVLPDSTRGNVLDWEGIKMEPKGHVNVIYREL
ncbi:C-reactive protein-like [Nelusetta ayraudi]|uniref:C-reactive protein-like n=1 Tax=Nelusetta ayraudi TaxID=303726 RepID=UPI003F6ED728